jgi:cation:H+ antiporter
MVVFIGWIRFRRTHVTLDRGHGLELVVLLVASIYAIWIPFREEISLIDMVVLAVIFAFYIWRLAKLPAEDPHLIGPAATIAALPTNLRRIVTAALAIAAAIAIIFVAHPFSDDLVHTGTQWGIDEFLLVQWVAPLASEAPEFVVVALFAFRGATTAAMGTLVSSKINQWTLLVGMLPLIYSISLGEASGLPLDNLQQDELFLTAAQTLCAVMFMLSLRLSGFAAITLFTLFVGQFFFRHHLIEFSVIYLVLGVASVIYRREGVRDTLRDVRVAFRDTS